MAAHQDTYMAKVRKKSTRKEEEEIMRISAV